MNPNDLAVTFSAAQLAVFLIIAVLALAGLVQLAVKQFQKGIDAQFLTLTERFDTMGREIRSRPTRYEVEASIRAVHQRIDDHVAIPRRRAGEAPTQVEIGADDAQG